ncbi:MAG: hypothetical protein KGJ13_05420 [Patescibacteria group bacterium]|nr:hypothetical protein [Patescibacteria group bacterium]
MAVTYRMNAATKKKKMVEVCVTSNHVTTGRVPGYFFEYHAPTRNAATTTSTKPIDQCNPIGASLDDFTDDVPRFSEYTRPQINDDKDKAGKQYPRRRVCVDVEWLFPPIHKGRPIHWFCPFARGSGRVVTAL